MNRTLIIRRYRAQRSHFLALLKRRHLVEEAVMARAITALRDAHAALISLPPTDLVGFD